jgi:hypothetical protein
MLEVHRSFSIWGKEIAMMKKLVALVFGLACVSAFADENVLPRQTYDGTAFITGGIGEEELEQINAARTDFNVRLLMTEKAGAYVTDVRVVIVDGKGKTVLETGSAGPYLLAKLSKGIYRVSASYEGRSQDGRLEVRDGASQMLTFYW